eukprot:TRINITY_DN102707_c0_g1_i1.p1 TRINITY_DN102707_c0_g1~~TRINITY_DN102707_c0_g1_i1.p1  ORF type:complete len:391 (-),score=74.21 TRINITY_DN102707_c0_g1_i1:199-1371(-)
MGGGSSAHAIVDPKRIENQEAAQAYAKLRKPPPEKQIVVRDRATLFAAERVESQLMPPEDTSKKSKVKVRDPRNWRPLLQMPGYVDAKVAAQRRMVEEDVKRKHFEKEEAMKGRMISMGVSKEVIDRVDQEVNARRATGKRQKQAPKGRMKKTTDEAVAMMTYSKWPMEQQWLMLDRLQYQRKWQVQKKVAEEKAALKQRKYLYATSSAPAKAPALSSRVDRNRNMVELMKSHAELMGRCSSSYSQHRATLEESQGGDGESAEPKAFETDQEHLGSEIPRWFNSMGIENEQTKAVARALSNSMFIEYSGPNIRSLSNSESLPSPDSSPLSPLSPLSLSSPASKRLSSKGESMASTAASLGDLHGTNELARQDRREGSKSSLLGNVLGNVA